MTKFYEVTDHQGNLLNQLTIPEYAEQIMEVIQKSELTSFAKRTYNDGALTHEVKLQGEESLTVGITKYRTETEWHYTMEVIPGWQKKCTVNEYYDILTEMRDKADKYEF
jgi:hypothetical protein